MNTKTLEVILGLKNQLGPGIQSTAGIAQRSKAAFAGLATIIKGLVAAFAAMVVLRQVGRWLRETIELSKIQEAAVTTLNAALRASGNYTLEASAALQDYAKSLQATLGIGDEVTLQTLGIIEGLTKLSAEALPGAMDAVIQISNLYRTDYNAAAILLGKSLTSNLNAFARYGIQIDMTGTAQERLNQILEATSAGMDIAIEKANTYEGATNKLTAAWGDYKEVYGDWITQSPRLIQLINLATLAVQGNTENVITAQGVYDDFIGKTLQSAINGIFSLIKVVAVDLPTAWNNVKIFFNEFGINILSSIRNTAEAGMIFIEASYNSIVLFLNKLDEAYANSAFGQFMGVSARPLSYLTIDRGPIFDLSNKIEDLQENISGLNTEINLYGVALNRINTIQQVFNDAMNSATVAAAGSGAGAGAGTGEADGGLAGALNDVAAAADSAAISLQNFLSISGATPGALSELGIGRGISIKPPHLQRISKPTPFFDKGKAGGGGMGIDWASLAAAGIGGAASGGVAGAAQAILPALGFMVGGPIGSAIGGLLGGLLGKKKKPRGDTKANPVFVYQTNTGDIATALLNVFKGQGAFAGGMSINSINAQIKGQGVTLGLSGA